jgi:hypothetical protein
MSKRQWLSLLGVWVMIFLFLGVPSLWHKIISVFTGLIIIFISYNLPPDRKFERKNTNVYVENNIER